VYTGSIPVVASTLLKPLGKWLHKKMTPTQDKPLTDAEIYWRDPAAGPLKLAHAWLNMMFVDHGFLRMAFPNRHELSPGVWRSSQPSPSQIKWFARQGGKTVLTLRGHDYRGSMFWEKRATSQLGLNLMHWRCRSDHVMSVAQIQKLVALLKTIETPVLIHCKSGADRMGFVSVIYAHIIKGEPIRKAMEQLSGRYLHIKSSKTGVLDHFFETYASAHEATGVDFETWLTTECNPDDINASFTPNGFAGWFERKILLRE